MRSPTRIIAASTLTFEAFVVFFGGLVAMQLSSLSVGTALGLFGGLALLCLLTAGLLSRPGGYVAGSLLQIAVIGTGFVVPAMFFMGGVFALLWFGGIKMGRDAEARAAATEGEPAA